MIAKGTTHNDGSRLAVYLITGKDGERAELAELRGFASDDIVEAFRSVHVMAEGTRCEQPFMHVQVRLPDEEDLTREQWQRTADRIESKLGLTGQARGIAFHINEQTGDRHMHVAWSRIDEDTLTAKPLPFFKLRLKEVCRELEEEFGITIVPNERNSHIKFAPTREEDEQARRLGLDPHEVREIIRNCFDRSDCGRSFRAALDDEGFTLAQGDRRGFVVIDQGGGIHALGKRILDRSAADLRHHLADLDRAQLPTVEQARANLERRMGAQTEHDPLREERAGVKVAAEAAMEKERATARLKGPEPKRKALEDSTEKQREQGQGPQTAPAPELGKTQGQIRLARSLTDGPQEFANALEDRGFILARVTRVDIEKDEARLKEQWEERRADPQKWMEHTGGFLALPVKLRAVARRSYEHWKTDKEDPMSLKEYVEFVQEQWQKGPPESALMKAPGGLAVVTPFGSAYILTPANTGLAREELTPFLNGIDRAQLLTVTDAQEVIREVRVRQYYEPRWTENEKHWPVWPAFPDPGQVKTSPRHHFEDAMREATGPEFMPPMPENLRGTAAQIWTAYNIRSWDRKEHGEIPAATLFLKQRDPHNFAAALEENGITLAVVTKEEADRSHRQSSFAREVRNFAPRYSEGEIVAIAEPGLAYNAGGKLREPRVYRLDRRTTSDDPANVRKFLNPIDRTELRGIDATKEALKARAEQRITEVQNFREGLRDTRNAERLKRSTTIYGGTPYGATAKRVLSLLTHKAANAVEKTPLRAAGKLGLGVVTSAVESLLAPPMTPDRKYEADIAHRERAAETDQQIDFTQYTTQRAIERRQEDHDREAERQHERERGRER